MKRLVFLALFIAGFLSAASAQEAVISKPPILLNPERGYITINEFTGGFGLGKTNTPYSKGFFGLTTIHGYQVNETYLIAGGTGVYFYNRGTLIPLFFDARYRIKVDAWTPYLFGDGGFLLDFSGKKDTRAFLNGGGGVSYTIKKSLAVNLGTGLFIQWGNLRDAYINFKAGIVYKMSQ